MYRLETGLDVGDFAPDFSLKDTKGKTVRLADFKGKENVLLAFYRGESDIYSINWLKKLDDDYLEIRALTTDVIAISADKENEVTFMKDKYSLSLRLLPDPGMQSDQGIQSLRRLHTYGYLCRVRHRPLRQNPL